MKIIFRGERLKMKSRGYQLYITLIASQQSHLTVAALKIEYVDKVTGYSVADLMR